MSCQSSASAANPPEVADQFAAHVLWMDDAALLPGRPYWLQIGSRTVAANISEIKHRVDDLHEANPMMGHRGCRLGITYPEITEMQSRAIIEAALNARAKGRDVKVEIMVPLVGTVREFNSQAKVIRSTIDAVFAERNETMPYLLGTMIETPRGALVADSIGKQAEFFSFGTNDLTQMTLGFSRDDIGKFLPMYLSNGMYEQDPFQSIDQKGVGLLVKDAVQNLAVVDADQIVAALDAGMFQSRRQHGADFRIRRHRGAAHRIGIALIELAETPRTGLFVAPDRPHRIAAIGGWQIIAELRRDAGQRRGQVIAQRQPVAGTAARNLGLLPGKDAGIGAVHVGQEFPQRLDRLDGAGFKGIEAMAMIDLGDAVEHLLAFGHIRAEIVTKPLGRLGLGSGLFILIFRHGLPRAGPCGV